MKQEMKLADDFDERNEEVMFYRTNPQESKDIVIKKIRFALSDKQRNELLNEAESNSRKHSLMIRTQLLTGMRVSELVNLRIQDVNFESRKVRIGRHEKDEYCEAWSPKTLSGEREVWIEDDLLPMLKGYVRDEKRIRGYLFTSQKSGTKYTTRAVIKFVNRYASDCKSIRHNIGSHTLRRTYASFLLKNGLPIADISKNLGHASIKVTMVYLYQIEDIGRHERTADALKGMVKPGKWDGKE